MPKNWGKQIFSLGSFPKVGQKQKTEKKRKRPKVGNNNVQLRIAKATLCGTRKLLGPKIQFRHICFSSSKTKNTTKK